MTTRKLYLRIGQDKAGTTTIGMFANANRATLLEHGVWAPLGNCAALIQRIGHDAGVRNFDFKASVQRPHTEQVVDSIIDGRDTPPHEVLFLNTETLWGRMCVRPLDKKRYRDEATLIFERLRQLFDAYDMHILVHLRRADLHNESAYGQHIKAGGKQTMAAFTAQRSKQGIARNCETLLRLLADIYGPERILIKPFEREQFRNGDLIDDLLAVFGLDATRLDLDLVRADHNERVHGILIPVLREFYAAGGARLGNVTTRELSEYIAQTYAFNDVRTYYAPAERAQVVAEYAAFYRYVSETFRDGQTLFREAVDSIPAPCAYARDELDATRRLVELVGSIARRSRIEARNPGDSASDPEPANTEPANPLARLIAVARHWRLRLGR